MVLRQFHKYLKVFEKKESERIPTRKTWDHHRSQRRICTKKREDVSIIKSRKRGSSEVCEGSVEEGIYHYDAYED